MSLSKKSSQVELGGYSASHLSKIQANMKSPSRPTPPLPSRQLIESTHRIPQTRSPSKSGVYQSMRLSRERENNQSFSDMNSSKISISSRNGDARVMLADRINRPSPQKQIVSISYPNRDSSSSSRNPARVQRVIVSPSKVPVVTQLSPKEVQLERKLRIVEGRIGQLHREKQEAVAKLNEENRKFYHENNSLKLKINDLTKIIERVDSMKKQSRVERPLEPHPQAIELSNTKLENETLRNEIRQLENYIASEDEKYHALEEQNNSLNNKIQELTSLNDKHAQNIAIFEQKLTSQLYEIEQSQVKIIELEIKLNQAKQLEEQTECNLRSQLKEQEDRYLHKIQIYDSKIKEYEVAYNQNQSLIRQLEEQIRTLQCQEVKEEEENQDTKLQQDLTNECMNLEGIFTQAIQERDQQISKIRSQNQLQAEKISKLEAEISQLAQCDEDKAAKLESASLLLDKMTIKFEELSERYTQMSNKYENEKSKMNKTEGFQAKCKKCDELLKTVLRLNNQLNPKKTAS